MANRFSRSGVIAKAKKGEIKILKSRELHSLPIRILNGGGIRSIRAQVEVEKKKLVNVVYHQGEYFVTEPNGDLHVPRDPDLVIDRHCWLIIKLLENRRVLVKTNDIIRFGRVAFKVTELVITPDEIKQAAALFEWAKNCNDYYIE